ncbi:MAG: hypothetical protein ACI9OD_004929 [Limisphaerales bacterium]|jgi:hypothetical protein
MISHSYGLPLGGVPIGEIAASSGNLASETHESDR